MPSKPSPEGWDGFARELGLRIQRRRIELALSQENVAYAAGLTRSYYQQLERGRSGPDRDANPSIRTLLALCDALNTDLESLIPENYREIASGTGGA